MTVCTLLQDWLHRSPRPPLDQWFSSRARVLKLTPQESRTYWEGLDREVRSALRRMVFQAADPVKAAQSMKRWTGADLEKNLTPCFRGDAPPLPEEESPLYPVSCGLPPWLEDHWDRRVAASSFTLKDSRNFLSNLQRRPPLYIRINRDSPEVTAALRAEGFLLSEVCEGGWEISGEKSLYLSEPWKAGQVEIQDLASQKAGLLSKVRPGMRVWDLCAGEGGKTLLLAGELRGKGSIWSTDIYPKKVEHLKQRSRRAGVSNLRTLVWDGKTFPDTPETLRKDFDAVVVDAPCSASGTWRRDPEAALRLFPGDIAALTRIQTGLLKTAWSRLKPGGRLVYITCSWLVEENEGVFDPFVKESGGTAENRGILGSPFDDSNTFWAGTVLKSK